MSGARTFPGLFPGVLKCFLMRRTKVASRYLCNFTKVSIKYLYWILDKWMIKIVGELTLNFSMLRSGNCLHYIESAEKRSLNGLPDVPSKLKTRFKGTVVNLPGNFLVRRSPQRRHPNVGEEIRLFSAARTCNR